MRDLLLRMLRRDNALRLSPEMQAKFAAAEASGTRTWLNVAEDIQRRVVVEHGFVGKSGLAHGLSFLRGAPQQEPLASDPEIQRAACYLEFNRATRRTLCAVGDSVPEIPVYLVDEQKQQQQQQQQQVDLRSLSKHRRFHVVVAGSLS
jgi:hypothetical protein